MTSKIEWDKIKLVIFDVDGTLYNQNKLRFSMLCEMLKHTLMKRDFSIFLIIKHYRTLREDFGNKEIYDFEIALINKTSQLSGYSEKKIREVINEWIEIRPLKYLINARYNGLEELFQALRENKKSIGILSDYKAIAKLNALKLEADIIVSAQDDEVKMLKPNPKGLNYIMKQAGVMTSETILIGDRDERDGLAARRAGTHFLIKKKKYKDLNKHSFVQFNDEVFNPLFN